MCKPHVPYHGNVRLFWKETGVLLERLQERSDFIKTELRIAQYLLEHGLEVKDASVDELAGLTQTSSASIVCLCKKLGMSGYRDFRIQFFSEYGQQVRTSAVDANMPFGTDDSFEQIAWRLDNLAAAAINNAITGFDYRQLERIVKRLDAAEAVNVFTVGTSIPAAMDFKTELIVSYAKILASRGCYTVALTADRASRLAAICREAIATNSSESSSFSGKLETFSSFDATHVILDCLYCWLFQRQFNRNMQHAMLSEKILNEHTADMP